ncbi:putative D-lactate dehydrogenase, mitochondrial [Glarea lozoyensis 74030]|uniref:Putative D-lactate dehydrogenase, mitochondrial n=1 Tax=Glarea lozoyensis (strain ATCC 74030 / MF5533) TaxID=1104152 RepID=H0EPL1_GLAL7|nr:putative D-lactate dehydrogenase, mitochondrial [Glarea lozoyensis 74030]
MSSRSRVASTLRRAKVNFGNFTRPIPYFAQPRWQSTASTEDAEGVAKGTTGSSKTIKFTSETYPSIKRDSRFAEITEEHVNHFRSLLGTESAIIDGVTRDATDDIEPFNGDWMRKYRGHTKLVLKPASTEEAINVAFFGLESYEKVQEAFREAKGQLSEILSAFELMDRQSQDLVHRVTKNKRPLESEYPFYCLIETSGSNTEHDSEKLEKFLEYVMEKEIVLDGVVAQDTTQVKALWGWREGVPECLGHWGGTYKYDLSIPISELYSLVEETRAKITDAGLLGEDEEHPVVDVVGYGHMGDSNLHLNVATRRYDKEVEKILEPFVYEWISKRSGSISAEHGLGLAKKNYIGYSRSDTMIRLMKQIKDLYDPVSGIHLL